MPAGTSYLFKENMLGAALVPVQEKGVPGGYYKFSVRNHFLHAVHPVGWIKRLDVEVDGATVEQGSIFFVLRGQWFIATHLRTIAEVYWNLCEQAEVCFKPAAPLCKGPHNIKCTFTTSMLEDTQVLDKNDAWPLRIEYVDGTLEL